MLGWLKSTKIHFIGIGGIGMSGIAEVLLDLGYSVSGSDLSSSSVTDHLKIKGAKIFQGHDASNIIDATIIVYSSAINPLNPEYQKAIELKIPMVKRAEMLAELMRLKFGVAIAGSHGKTTTTSLVATIFQEAKLDATYIIGGIVKNLGGNAKKGDGDYLIAEADESDGSFLILNPTVATVTNIDDDHLDYYKTKEKVTEAFINFANKIPFFGRIIMNANDETSWSIRDFVKRPTVWYGVNSDLKEVAYAAKNVQLSASGSSFDVYYLTEFKGRFSTHLLGLHNVSNTLAAIATCRETGINWESIAKGLLNFSGVSRRLEKLYEKDSFLIVDDYGHHPTEVLATISAIKAVDKRPLAVLFEPHRYTRTESFWNEFQRCFVGVDEVYILPIYSASEPAIPGISSERLVQEMQHKGINAKYISDSSQVANLFKERQSSKRIILSLGAGSISKLSREAVKKL